jgi:hypothetical protein
MMVKPIVVFWSETWAVADGCERIWLMREKNMRKDIWTSGRARDMENKN